MGKEAAASNRPQISSQQHLQRSRRKKHDTQAAQIQGPSRRLKKKEPRKSSQISSQQRLQRPRRKTDDTVAAQIQQDASQRLKGSPKRKTADDAGLGLCTTTQAVEIQGPQIYSQQHFQRPRRKTHNTEAAQIQGPSRRLKGLLKTKTADDAGHIPCTTQAVQIQGLSPGSRRPTSSTTAIPSLNWGAKRPRTLYRRDWANLGEGPLGLIAECVLAGDVADYIRFRAVCLPWRQCSAAPRERGVLEDRRLHPRRWVMLLGEKEQLEANSAPHCILRHFLNTSTGQTIQVDVPELHDHGVLQSTASEGLLLLLHKTTGSLRLLNPLTRQMAELPPISGLGNFTPGYVGSASINTAGLADDNTILLYFSCDDGTWTLAFAKPSDERWLLVKTHTEVLLPTMSFAGRFYGVTSKAIMTLDMREENLPPQLVVAAKLPKPVSRMQDTVHLVDNDGELMLVHRTIRLVPGAGDACAFPFKRTYKVYCVDLEAGKMMTHGGGCLSLAGRAVFIGRFRALSVSPQVFPSISADTIYPGLELSERSGHEQIGAYYLKDGSTEPFDYDYQRGLWSPWSIADCLAAYVSG